MVPFLSSGTACQPLLSPITSCYTSICIQPGGRIAGSASNCLRFHFLGSQFNEVCRSPNPLFMARVFSDSPTMAGGLWCLWRRRKRRWGRRVCTSGTYWARSEYCKCPGKSDLEREFRRHRLLCQTVHDQRKRIANRRTASHRLHGQCRKQWHEVFLCRFRLQLLWPKREFCGKQCHARYASTALGTDRCGGQGRR